MSKQPKFEVSKSKNKNLVTQCGFQKVWKILLLNSPNSRQNLKKFKIIIPNAKKYSLLSFSNFHKNLDQVKPVKWQAKLRYDLRKSFTRYILNVPTSVDMCMSKFQFNFLNNEFLGAYRYLGYGSTGCGVFKQGVEIKKIFAIESTYSKEIIEF